MDKRTLIFVLTMTVSLLLVNTYFENRQLEKNKIWYEQQKAIKRQKIEAYEDDIDDFTTPISEFNIVKLYDEERFLTSGMMIDGNVITFPGKKTLPKDVTINQKKYEQAYLSDDTHDLVIYRSSDSSKLPTKKLPFFGNFYLQLVGFNPINVNLGIYNDGSFTVPIIEMQKLQSEVSEEKRDVPDHLDQHAIALVKSGDKYIPVAVYNKETNSLIFLDQMPDLAAMTEKEEKKDPFTPGKKGEEKFYVLETPYQQLVFSNYGGALAEINLPFRNEQNKKSIVKEIEFDRLMVENHPYNAHFPSHPYMTPGFEEHSTGKLGGYYPLIRRDLIESGQYKSIRISPKFYSMNTISEYPELAELNYEVTEFNENKIVFEAEQRNRKITKTYTLDKDVPYVLNLTLKVDGDARGLWLSSGIPEVELFSGRPAPSLKYRITRNQKADVETIDIPKDAITVSTINPDWVCNSNGFLGTILDPVSKTDAGFRVQKISGTVAPSRLIEIDQEYELYKAEDLPGYLTMLPLKSSGGTMQYRIYAGPFAESTLLAVDKIYSDPATGYNPDYIACQSFHGWFAFISAPFSKFLFMLMKIFYSFTGSWAFSIVLLTVALRIMLYPLNAWSTKSMIKMQQIAPEVTRIQEKYKKDPKKSQLEIMNLYRDRGVNPISGCFPILIQMPFLIGMFDLLKSTFELRGATFIPGWIDNLAAPDVLFSWQRPIFFIGTEFHLLPILLGFVMFVQQRFMSTAPKDPSQMTEQQRQQKAMGTIMPVLFAVMFYSFPSGLNIYWLSSMVLGILQQWWTAKKMKKPQVEIDTSRVAKATRKK